MCLEGKNGSVDFESKSTEPFFKVFDEIISNLRNLDQFDLATLEKHIKWCNKLTQLASTYGQVSSFVHEFDYSSKHPFNGCRTYLKMVHVYFCQIDQSLRVLKKNARHPKHLKKLRTLRCQCPVFNSMGESMTRIHQIRSDKGHDFYNDEEFVNDSFECLMQSRQELGVDKLIHYFNLDNSCPWIKWPMGIRPLFKLLIALFYLSTTPLSRSIFGIFSTAKLTKFYVKQFGDSCSVRKLPQFINRFYNSRIFHFIAWATNLFNYKVQALDLVLKKRQSHWSIGPKSIERCGDNSEKDHKAIECMLLKPRKFDGDNLVLFIHGGGFVAFTKKSGIHFLRSIVLSTGAAVLSVEYSFSPEVKHPVALQECLDVYLDLVSSDPMTGFKPKNILLVGDSAGAHLALGVAIAIAEIRQMQMSSNEKLIPLPRAINSSYAITSGLMGHLWPSRALIEPLLTPGVVFTFSNAHSGPIDEEVYFKEHGCHWLSDEMTIRKAMSQINSRISDPFFNLLGYKHFDRLKDVPLYIQANEFDMLLDDSIELAKCWKGPVVMDFIPNGLHGWILYDFLMNSKFAGPHLVINRLKETLERQVSESE